MPEVTTDGLYCIRFLGLGTDGRVALVCDRAGRVGVLKLYYVRVSREAEKEGGGKVRTTASVALDLWRTVYEDVPALTSRIRTVSLREPFFSGVTGLTATDALLMPYLMPVKENRRRGLLPKLEECLGQFVRAGYEHRSVAWRNIGTYTDNSGEEQVVLFDMMGARKGVREKGPAWVARVIDVLHRE